MKAAMKTASPYFYLLFRVIIGMLFAVHGAQKLGILGDGSISGFAAQAGVPYVLALIACLTEFLGGIAIAFGVLTRLAAFGSAIVLLTAYFMAHPPAGLNLIANGGEMALIYIGAFFGLMAHGNGDLSVEKALTKKEMF